jgi:hypothetical protein
MMIRPRCRFGLAFDEANCADGIIYPSEYFPDGQPYRAVWPLGCYIRPDRYWSQNPDGSGYGADVRELSQEWA